MDTTRTILKSFLQYKFRDKKNTIKDLKEFIWVLNHLTNCLHEYKTKIKSYQVNLEVLLVKAGFHGSTIAQLFDGSDIITHKKRVVRFPDISSIYVLVRGLIENYFMLYYLNFDITSDEQGIFRNLLYEASGLNMRQGYDVKHKIGVEKKKREKGKLEKIKEEILNNKYFLSLPVKKQKELIKKLPPRELGFEQLITKIGILSKEFILLWKLSSNYAHSEYLSAIQITDYLKQKEDMEETMFSVLYQSLIVFALMIKDLVRNYKSIELTYNTLDSELRTKIDWWSDLAKKIK